MPLERLLWSGCLVLHLAPGCLAMYMAVLSFAKPANQEIQEDGNHLLASGAGRAAARREIEAKCPRSHAQASYAQCAHSIQHPAWVAATFHTGGVPPLARKPPAQMFIELRPCAPYHMGCSSTNSLCRRQSRLQSKIRLYNSEFAFKSFQKVLGS